MDWGVIFATLIGPILAVQAQKWVERWREDANRRLSIFKTLMATRGAALSPQHVQALNSIDLEFHGDKFKTVHVAWREYRDHLYNFPTPPAGQAIDEAAAKAWQRDSSDFLTKLLVAMGKLLKYDFDAVDIKRGSYTPIAHETQEAQARLLIELMGKTFAGETPLKLNVVGLPVNPEMAKLHAAALSGLGNALQDGALSVELKQPPQPEQGLAALVRR